MFRGIRICFVSTVGSLSETPIQLWLETMVEAGYKVTVIMPQIESQEDWMARLDIVSLPRVPYFWPDANPHQTSMILIKRAKNAVLLMKYLLWLRPQICVCSEPDAWLACIMVRSLTRMKVILYLREVFEDRIQAFPAWSHGILLALLRKTMTWLSGLTDEIVHVSPERQEWYGYLRKRGVIIHHYPRLAWFSSPADSAVKQGLSERVVIVHAGALRPTYGSDVLINGFMQAHQNCENLRLLVLGGIAGTLKSMNLIEELISKGALELREHIPHGRVLALLQSCDIGIVHVLDNSVTTRLAEPTKLYEYLASRLPVVASNVPTMQNIVEKWGCGLLFEPSCAASIANTILQLAEDLNMRQKFSANAARAAKQELNWENEQPKLMQLLESLSIPRVSSKCIREDYV